MSGVAPMREFVPINVPSVRLGAWDARTLCHVIPSSLVATGAVLLLTTSAVGAPVVAVAAEFRPVATHLFPFQWTSLPPPANNVSLPTYATLFPPVVKRGVVVVSNVFDEEYWTLGAVHDTPPSVLTLNAFVADLPVATRRPVPSYDASNVILVAPPDASLNAPADAFGTDVHVPSAPVPLLE
jgi:hypothetical protein